jgi:serine/threonine protein kinase/Flp pilus assembly protein TadD
MSEASLQEDVSPESLVARVADDFLARQRRGQRPDIEDYAARYPQAAGLLRKVLAALEVVGASLGGGTGSQETCQGMVTGTLGDFRLVREVGRGGMGIVYEAEQVSLHCRVALKVLPLAATLDPRQLQRFHNEAQAAASLHHTHIVPVYFVGCDRGVHYYAMQFIDGQTLAQLIRQLSQADVPPSGEEQTTVYPGPAAAVTAPAAQQVTQAMRSVGRGQDYFRQVAQLGVQAAEALDHAHQVGIVHRDVKPGNLLLDGRGILWVTDFGLAHVQSEASLTMTGDLVGTLRYMSPEQALAKRVPLDHRTDVYSLGATLYELLTLRPAFAGKDRQELLRQIAFEEPVRPRQLDRKIPAELETIILKALEKNAADRYGTAQALADDLERFLKDEPIRARRPTLVQRARKWSRRHKPVVAALATGLLSVLVVAVVLGFWYQGRRAETERGVTAALAQAEVLLDEGDRQTEHAERWQATARLAQGAVEKAEELLAAGAARQALAERVQRVRAAAAVAVTDSRLLVELDRIRLEQAAVNVKENHFDEARAAPLYAELLRSYGVDLAEPQQAAARVRDSQQREALLAALEDWSRLTRDEEQRRRLEQVLQSAELDVDPFRARWRAAWRQRDGAALRRLADEPVVQALPATALHWLARDLKRVNERTAAEQVLRAGLDRYPSNFWLNNELGLLLCDREPSRAQEAVPYLMVAVALRSDSAGTHLNLGWALREKGDLEGAIRGFRAACRIDPNYALAHINLGHALQDKHRPDEAIDEYREALRLKPDLAEVHWILGHMFLRQGRFAEGHTAFKRGHELGSKDPRWTHPRSAQWVREVELFAALEGKLPKLLKGEAQPADAAERVALAQMCVLFRKNYYAAASRFYTEAFTAQPSLALDSSHRYNAACAAALAAAGQGQDADKLDSTERGRLRRLALDWLRAELAQWIKHLENGSPETRPGSTLGYWQIDSDLASLRGEAALAKLPAEEQAGWRRLWTDVAQAVAKLRQQRDQPEKSARKP